jgi:Tol biopolymer transport system component
MTRRQIILADIVLCIALLSRASAPANAQFGGSEIEPPYELWTIDAAGGTPRRLVETPGYTCGSPDWSPDGKLIAFDTWRDGRSYDDSKIAVIHPDGKGLQIIGDGGMPSWSPDGTQIACHTYGSPQTIAVMNADGGGPETIIDHWGSPRWSPRGNRVASLDTDRQILIFDLATGKERRLLPRRYAGTYHYTAQVGFAFAPDGRRICFGDSDGLFLATLADGKSQPSLNWLVKGGAARHCSWSPDGKRVVFAWKQPPSDLEQLFVVDADSGEPPTRLPGQDLDRNNSCPDWSPDGKTIVFVKQKPPGSGDTRGGGMFEIEQER